MLEIWEDTLESGWGEDPPNEVKDRTKKNFCSGINNWTPFVTTAVCVCVCLLVVAGIGNLPAMGRG